MKPVQVDIWKQKEVEALGSLSVPRPQPEPSLVEPPRE